MPRQRWVPNRGKQTAAPLSSERGKGRERSFYIEKAHSARRFTLKDIACVLLAQTKDAKIVCVIAVGSDFSTRNLKRLASARHLIERNCTLTRLHASNKPVSEDEKADDVISRRHLYCGRPVVTSWAVAGQQVVFLHMYLQTRVTLRAFPVATPRGRSVEFPWRGTNCIQWSVFFVKWALKVNYKPLADKG